VKEDARKRLAIWQGGKKEDAEETAIFPIYDQEGSWGGKLKKKDIVEK